MLDVTGIQESDDRFWHRPLAGHIPLIGGPDLVNASIEIVPKPPHQFVSEFFLRGTRAAHEDRQCGRLGAFDALDVVVRHRGAPLRLAQDLGKPEQVLWVRQASELRAFYQAVAVEAPTFKDFVDWMGAPRGKLFKRYPVVARIAADMRRAAIDSGHVQFRGA